MTLRTRREKGCIADAEKSVSTQDNGEEVDVVGAGTSTSIEDV